MIKKYTFFFKALSRYLIQNESYKIKDWPRRSKGNFWSKHPYIKSNVDTYICKFGWKHLNCQDDLKDLTSCLHTY